MWFGPIESEDYDEAWTHICQNGTLREYQMEFGQIECPDGPKRPWSGRLGGGWRMTSCPRFACSNHTLSVMPLTWPIWETKSCVGSDVTCSLIPTEYHCAPLLQALHPNSPVWNASHGMKCNRGTRKAYAFTASIGSIPVTGASHPKCFPSRCGRHWNRNHHGWKAEWWFWFNGKCFLLKMLPISSQTLTTRFMLKVGEGANDKPKRHYSRNESWISIKKEAE